MKAIFGKAVAWAASIWASIWAWLVWGWGGFVTGLRALMASPSVVRAGVGLVLLAWSLALAIGGFVAGHNVASEVAAKNAYDAGVDLESAKSRLERATQNEAAARRQVQALSERLAKLEAPQAAVAAPAPPPVIRRKVAKPATSVFGWMQGTWP